MSRTGSPRAIVLREIGLALAVTVFLTVSPFTPNEIVPSLGLGALVGGGLLAWRLRRDSDVWKARPEGRPTWGRQHVAAIASTGVVLLAFAPTFQWMFQEWTRSVWVNEHGLMIPPLMAWFAWNALRDDDGPPESSAWGFPLLVAGLALAALDAVPETRYLAAIGLLLVLPGLSLLLLGPRRTRALRLPLILSLLLIPLPFTLATPLALRSITAVGTLEMLHVLGFTALREGTFIQTPQQNFLVADACSGIATLYASVACALIVSATTSGWRRLLALAIAAPLAIAVNVVRVTLLMLMANALGVGLLETPLHEATGVATFVIVVGTLLWIARPFPATRQAA